jgi:transmembrane sensor
MPGTEKEYTRISILYNKYLNSKCSDKEAQEIVEILEHSENDISLMNEAQLQWYNIEAEHNNHLKPAENRIVTDRILDRLHRQIRLHEEESPARYSLQKKFYSIFTKVAAILILPLLVYSIYLTSRTSSLNSSEELVWQTIKTPAGMQTDFILPDGSHVWLNSGTILKYPLSFASDKRQVDLTGEAFFDVIKDASHPFLVKAGKMNIEVKGTRFNVLNYQDETLTKLILESGSVRLFSGDYDNRKTITNIKPGEIAVLNTATNQLSVSKVDVEKYTAWKEGLLIFRDDQMDEVVRKLNRWFNVEIILQNPGLKDYVYTATYRDETLPQILELLKISAPINYSITERKRLDDNSYSKRKIVITKRN